ncbi:MAG: DUF975 family protein [Enterocloster asparagiformis]|nr:DUF975 family protein [Enterocloster asparagiformis]
MKKAAVYRAQARNSLHGRYGNLVLARVLGLLMVLVASVIIVVMLMYTVVFTGASLYGRFGGGIPFSVVLMSIMIALLFLLLMATEVLLEGGNLKMAHKVFRGQETKLGDMFYGFRKKAPWRILGIGIVTGLIQLVFMIPYFVCSIRVRLNWTMTGTVLLVLSWLLFLAASVAISLFLGLALYVMIDCPDLGAMACLRASVKLTKRRRWQLFCFHLSFIGWHILGQLSYGIGMLWIMPYIQCATFGVYQDLKAEKEQLGIRWRPDPAAENHTAAS